MVLGRLAERNRSRGAAELAMSIGSLIDGIPCVTQRTVPNRGHNNCDSWLRMILCDVLRRRLGSFRDFVTNRISTIGNKLDSLTIKRLRGRSFRTCFCHSEAVVERNVSIASVVRRLCRQSETVIDSWSIYSIYLTPRPTTVSVHSPRGIVLFLLRARGCIIDLPLNGRYWGSDVSIFIGVGVGPFYRPMECWICN